MRRIVLLVILTFVVCLSANAQQSYSKVEVFGGYSYFNTDPNADSIFARKLEHQMTVYNSLTNLRSIPFSFVR